MLREESVHYQLTEIDVVVRVLTVGKLSDEEVIARAEKILQRRLPDLGVESRLLPWRYKRQDEHTILATRFLFRKNYLVNEESGRNLRANAE